VVLLFAAPARAAEPGGGAPLTLDDLVKEALVHNLQVHIDQAKLGEAQALLQLAEAQSYPRFDAQGLFGGPTREAKTMVVNVPSSVTHESLSDNFDFGELGITIRGHVDVIQPIYTFGKIDAAKSAAKNVVDAANEKVTVTRAEVVLNMHRAFWGYQLTRAYVTSLSDGAATLEKVLLKITALLDRESPQVTENDRLRLTHALATVRVRRAEAANASELALKAIRLLLGRAQTATISLARVDLEELPDKPPALASVLPDYELRRPELRALAALIRAQEQYAELRKKQLFPDIFAGALLDFAVTTNATHQTSPFVYDPYNGFTPALGLGVRIELDLWTKLAQIEQAKAELGTRMAERAAADQAVDLEIRKIYADLVSAYEKIVLLRKAETAGRGWLAAAALSYDVGVGDARELVEAFTAYETSLAELKRTLYDARLGLTDLLRAGGRLVQ
jgi:outer membrane protein TolC